jgi:hypothetical protein
LQLTERSARIVHAGMLGGVAIMILVITALRTTLSLDPFDQLTTVFRGVAVGVLVLAVFVMRTVRSSMELIEPRGDRDAWWRANMARAMVVWAVAEGAALAGAMFWLLTGGGDRRLPGAAGGE